MYTIRWAGLQPYESGWSPPSDTHEVHARDRREDPDVLGVALSAIDELQAEGAVDVGSQLNVGPVEGRGE